MKKFIAICMIISCAGLVFAQDIIVLKTGENIEDVTVKSIMDTEILYVTPDGSDASMPRNNVSAIFHSDGRYEEIRPVVVPSTEESEAYVNDEAEEKRLKQEQKAREEEARKQEQAASKAASIEAARIAQEQKRQEEEARKKEQAAAKAAAIEAARIEKEQARLAQEKEYQNGLVHKISANKFYYVDKYYSKKDINSIIIQECPSAQQYYKKAKKWVIGGWCGFGAGLAMLVTGSVLTAIGIDAEMGSSNWVDGYTGYDEYGYWTTYYGHYETVSNPEAFLQLTLPGIIFSSCATQKESDMALNFGLTQNGLGLTLHF